MCRSLDCWIFKEDFQLQMESTSHWREMQVARTIQHLLAGLPSKNEPPPGPGIQPTTFLLWCKKIVLPLPLLWGGSNNHCATALRDTAFLKSSSENCQPQNLQTVSSIAKSGHAIKLRTNTANKMANREKRRPLKTRQWLTAENERGDEGNNVSTAHPWCDHEQSFRMELDRQQGWLCPLWRTLTHAKCFHDSFIICVAHYTTTIANN